MKKIAMTLCALLCALTAGAIDRVVLIDKSEMTVSPDEILHLPGLGLGLRCGPDSVMMLDNPDFDAMRWHEPNDARSIVGCGGAVYAAEGDSIYRVATDSLTRQSVGRLDNEQFTLHAATDSTFYALTADEDFSCVYEINPSDRTCIPFFSVEGALLKISTLGQNTMLWIDDSILAASPEGQLVPVFVSPTISDMVLTPVGLMTATAEGLNWTTAPGKGTTLTDEAVARVWWDDADVLYYLTAGGDLHAIIGLEEAYTRVSGTR